MHGTIRLTWFVLVGWWLVVLWLSIAFVAMLSLIGWPLAYKMFDTTWEVMTLDVD